MKIAIWIGMVLLLTARPGRSADAGNDRRTFKFTYSVSVDGLAPKQPARVWLPVPSNGVAQHVEIIGKDLPGDAIIAREAKYGNQVAYFKAVAGEDGSVHAGITYRIDRKSVAGAVKEADANDEPVVDYLRADALVPVGGKSLSLLKDKPLHGDSMALGRLLYDVVDDHLQYRKDKPGWGHGDSNWACDSGFGNCTDFHSLFISLARANHLPAKFEIGFLLPEARGKGTIRGYHCWAWFQPAAKAWVPVDISEANQHPALRDYYFGNLDANRVKFSVGRDLILEPKQEGPPINFFIHAYVEVDGKSWAAGRIAEKYGYEDEPRSRRPLAP
jgi:transglutaminase-like putative cysteine protease